MSSALPDVATGSCSAAPPSEVWAWATEHAHGEASLPTLEGAWWEVKLLEPSPHAALVSFGAFADADGSEARHQQWVPWSRMRPPPPQTPPDLFAAVREGQLVQVWWNDGWWDATFVGDAEAVDSGAPADDTAGGEGEVGWGDGGGGGDAQLRDETPSAPLASVSSRSEVIVRLKTQSGEREKERENRGEKTLCGEGEKIKVRRLAVRPAWEWVPGGVSGSWKAPCIGIGPTR